MVIVEPADIVRLHTATESAASDSAVEPSPRINVPPLMSYIEAEGEMTCNELPSMDAEPIETAVPLLLA